MHRVQRHRRIDQRFALLHRGIADRHVHHIGAKPFASKFEGRLRPGRGFEEQVDLRQAAQRRGLLFSLAGNLDGFVGPVEQERDVLFGQALDAEQVAMRKEIHGEPPHLVKLRGSIMTAAPPGKAKAAQTGRIPTLLWRLRTARKLLREAAFIASRCCS
jgi:hypothetical protein